MKLYHRSEYLVFDKQFKLSNSSACVKKSAEKTITIRDDDFLYLMNTVFKASTTVYDMLRHVEKSEKKFHKSTRHIVHHSHKIKSLIRFMLNSFIAKKNQQISDE
ncbi:hypothetical protein GF337_08245 [candidate division KSB1 bacterium]|nr:hypothetical protein [candidate division KSB1 bacterium]